MITSYLVISFIDTRSFITTEGKGNLPLYITLMAISCAISIANVYVADMPSPADPIKQFILAVTGS